MNAQILADALRAVPVCVGYIVVVVVVVGGAPPALAAAVCMGWVGVMRLTHVFLVRPKRRHTTSSLTSFMHNIFTRARPIV